MEEDAPQGYTAAQLNQPTAEDVVGVLRSGQRPDAIYGLLRQYWSLHRGNPLVVTDRGHALYIDYNPVTERLTLYVGAEVDLCKLYEVDTKKAYVLQITDKYDFNPCSATKIILRSHYTGAAISRYLLPSEPRPGMYMPALYIEVSADPQETASCILRNEWAPLATGEEHPKYGPNFIVVEPVENKKPTSMLAMAKVMSDKNSEVSRSQLSPILHPLDNSRRVG
jgi:hypothetical protein